MPRSDALPIVPLSELPPGELATQVHLLSIRPAPSRYAPLQTVEATYRNGRGDDLARRRSVVEYRPSDVADVVASEVVEGVPYVYLTESLRQALLARHEQGLDLSPSQGKSKILSLPGGYIGDDGLVASAMEVVTKKIGVVPLGAPRILGGAVLPNEGVSPELSFPVIIKVRSDTKTPFALLGEGFSASRTTHRLSYQEVVDRYLGGTLSDPRCFVHVCRAAEVLREREEINSALTAPREFSTKIQGALAQLEPSVDDEAIRNRILNPRQISALLLGESENANKIASVSVEEVEGAPATDFIRSYALTVENQNEDGKPIGNSYTAEAIVRRFDILNVVTTVKVDDEIFMVANLGLREALELRDRYPRVMHTLIGARNVEGVNGSFYADEAIGISPRQNIEEVVYALTARQPVGEPQMLQATGYLSPGFNATGFRQAHASLHFGPGEAALLPEGVFLVRPGDVLELHRCGVIRSLLFVQAAQMLALAVPECAAPSEREWVSPRSAALLAARLSKDPEMMRIIREFSPDLRELMKREPELAAPITRLVNAGGLHVERPARGSPEAQFFSSQLGVFTVHPDSPPLLVAQLFCHDNIHHDCPDPLPYIVGADGTLTVSSLAVEHGEGDHDFLAYRREVMNVEIDAVTYSDVLFPQKYGVAKFERELGSGSIAGLFEEAGITELNAQRAVIADALMEGKLPESVLRVLSTRRGATRYESVVREKLLGYYVRDTCKNVRVLFDAWRAMPDVAAAAHALGARVLSEPAHKPAEFSARVAQYARDGAGRREASGINPLKADLSKAWLTEVYERVLRLTYIKSHLPPERTVERNEVQELIAELMDVHLPLKNAIGSVKNMDFNAANVAADNLLRELTSTLFSRAATREERLLADSTLLPKEVREALHTRRHAPFPILDFDPRHDAESQREVISLLHQQLQAHNFPIPDVFKM